eukprot:TRINITY_DN35467_c0_g1_i1.p1 TRINITY_DN35467_c0_g1~~TRINITY_DN35467_c0_g1_i1.p1  ORF type:complete len:174 (-),score=33.43 TRINITY_DN35467_c0_g1_i1:228-749(-)
MAQEMPEECEPGVEWNPNHVMEIPPRGIFDQSSLARWDGDQLPMCVGCCGKVIEVSSSDNFVPGYGYGALWAGKDATLALATLSLKPEDANRTDFTVSQFNEEELRALAGWYKHFTSKYQVIGTMAEYKDWDFSAVERLAETLPEANAETMGSQKARAADSAQPKSKGRIVSM